MIKPIKGWNNTNVKANTSLLLGIGMRFYEGSILSCWIYIRIGMSDLPGEFSMAIEATMMKAPLIISILLLIIGPIVSLGDVRKSLIMKKGTYNEYSICNTRCNT